MFVAKRINPLSILPIIWIDIIRKSHLVFIVCILIYVVSGLTFRNIKLSKREGEYIAVRKIRTFKRLYTNLLIEQNLDQTTNSTTGEVATLMERIVTFEKELTKSRANEREAEAARKPEREQFK